MPVLINGIGKLSGLLSVFCLWCNGEVLMSLQDVEKQIGKKRTVSSEHIDWGGRKKGGCLFRNTGQRPKPKFSIKPYCVLVDRHT